MKTVLKLPLLFLSCLFFLSTCNTKQVQRTSTAICYLKDVTASARNQQSASIHLTSEKILNLAGLNTNPMLGVLYYQSIITEVHLNQISPVKLPPADPSNYNKFKRRNQIKRFLKKTTAVIQDLESVAHGRNSSSIFIPVAKIINRLAKTKTNRQILVLQSDLFENTFILSKYDASQMKKIEDFPKFLHTILDKETPINQRLDNMEIFIVHQPESDTDKDFYLISNTYKSWLESKGAKVEILASLEL